MGTKDKSIWITSRYVYDSDFYTPFRFGQFSETTKYVRTTTGVSNPRWQSQVAAHQSATTAYTGTFHFLDSRPGGMNVRYSSVPGDPKHPTVYTEHCKGDYASYAIQNPSGGGNTLAVAQSRAMTRFNAKCQKVNRLLDGGTVVGELRETLHMLRKPAESLFKGLGQYLDTVNKRSRGKRTRPSLKKIAADTWLEHAFGWVPFFSDIAAAKALYDRVGSSEKMVDVVAGAKQTQRLVTAVPNTYLISDYCHISRNPREWEETHYKIKGQILQRAVTNTQSVIDAAGFTPDQFIPTAWELLPWSFLVDYFTNIGDVLSYNHSAFSGLAWVTVGYATDLVREEAHVPNIQKTAQVLSTRYRGAGGKPGYAKKTIRIFSRTGVLPSMSIPMFEFQLPELLNQQLNILALLAGADRIYPQKRR